MTEQQKPIRFEDLKQSTKMKIITININEQIVKAIQLLIKNGWINTRSEYIRQLIMDDIQFRFLDAPNIIDLHPELDQKEAEFKNLYNKVIQLYKDGNSIHQIITTVKRHKRIIQEIICEYIDKEKQKPVDKL